MKLSTWAKSQGISYQTAWRWFKANKLPVNATKTKTGTILIQPETIKLCNSTTTVYCRVSSPQKKDDLERQVTRCLDYCAAQGWEVTQVIREVASGLNDKRPKLNAILAKPPTRLVVEHKDRLTRFGFAYFETLLPQLGCTLTAIHRDKEEQDDLLKDFAAIITSFCCRLYGLRRGKAKAKGLKDNL